MESEDEAKAAIAALDGHTLHGSRISVEVQTLLYRKYFFSLVSFFLFLFDCYAASIQTFLCPIFQCSDFFVFVDLYLVIIAKNFNSLQSYVRAI